MITSEHDAGGEHFVALLRANVARRSDHVAFRFLEDGERETVTLTYAEFDRRARAAAVRIRRDASPGDRVVLLYTSGIEFVVALVGCFYAGVVAVPLYLPLTERAISTTERIVRHCEPVLCLSDVAEQLAAGGADRLGVPVVSAEELAQGDAAAWEPPALTGESLAMLQYTSGSTADPKGVMVRHRNLLANQAQIRRTFGQDENSVVVNWLPLYHDMGLIGGVLHALYLGATCVLMSPLAFLQRPLRWLEAIHRYRATVTAGPNFSFALCAERATPAEVAALDLSCWKVACCGGEPVRAASLQRFAEVFAPAGFDPRTLAPCYGLAESTLIVTGVAGRRGVTTLADDDGRDARERGSKPQPLVACGEAPDEHVAIVERATGRRCAAGAEGEIWVRGPSVAGGYWRDPEATAATFGATLVDGAGLYLRTGDLGFVANGELFVTGRAKDLLIVRGQNHYPQDLEATIDALGAPFRRGCGAVFQDGDRVVVVQEIRAGVAPDAALADQLRAAIVREHGIHVDDVCLCAPGAVAKTSSGKIRRTGCRDAYRAGEYTAVFGPTASPAPAPSAGVDGIAETVARVLGTRASDLDKTAPLTTLGLDSLKAVQLQHELHKARGCRVTLASLLEGASVAQLESAVRAPGDSGVAATGPAPADEAVSFGEQALFYLNQFGGSVQAYNLSRAFWLGADADLTALARSLADLIERHPVLRSRYALVDGRVTRQYVGPLDALEVRTTALDDSEALVRLAAECAAAPFDLERGPLFRAVLLQPPRGRSLLVLAAHHIVLDFGSVGVLLRELAVLYAAHRMGVAIALPPPGARYADFVAAQRRLVDSDAGRALERFWTAALPAEIPTLRLPSDRTRPSTPSQAAHWLAFPVDEGDDAAVRRLAAAHETTPYVVLLAAWAAFVHRLTGDEAIVVGTPALGRPRHEFDRVVGLFVNTIPLAFGFGAEPSFADLISDARRRATRALDAQDLPLSRIVELVAPSRGAARVPLFETMFGFLSDSALGVPGLAGAVLEVSGTRIDAGGLALEVVRIPQGHTVVDLDLLVGDVAGRFHCRLTVAEDVLSRAGAAAIAGYWRHFLHALLAAPAASIARAPLVAPDALAAVDRVLNAPGPPTPPGATLHGLFIDAAARWPDHPAAVTPDGAVTFARLRRSAGNVARTLRRIGRERGEETS